MIHIRFIHISWASTFINQWLLIYGYSSRPLAYQAPFWFTVSIELSLKFHASILNSYKFNEHKVSSTIDPMKITIFLSFSHGFPSSHIVLSRLGARFRDAPEGRHHEGSLDLRAPHRGRSERWRCVEMHGYIMIYDIWHMIHDIW